MKPVKSENIFKIILKQTLLVKHLIHINQNKRMNGNFLITIPLFGEFVNGI